MPTLFTDDVEVHVPRWVNDLKSFRRWRDSEDFPEEGRICFLNGEVWADMSKQQVFTHVDVKTEVAGVLRALAKAERLGRFLGDGVLVSNVSVEFAVIPDGVFLSKKPQEGDGVRLLEGKEGGCIEIEGTPDMVVEVVSRSSVQKDTVLLKKLYWEAGIPEYWLIDARKEPLLFEVFRHTARGYAVTRKQGGWVKSAVFGKSFRLTRQNGDRPDFTLELR
jgi:Uma2 family endonuclease